MFPAFYAQTQNFTFYRITMNKNNLCIATISWARNENEEKVLTNALEQLASFNIPVFITDGGSRDSFLQFLQNIPHFTLLKAEGKGVYAQAKNSLQAAGQTGSSFILYTEPDKEDFFRAGLPSLLDRVEEAASLGVHLASRSKTGFATFPAFQQMTETTINNCCKELIGDDVDYTYGPFLLNKKLVAYLDKVYEDIGWGWRPFIFTIAKRLGLDVKAFVQDFACPEEQRNDDQKERVYRMRQLEQNIRGIVLAANAELL